MKRLLLFFVSPLFLLFFCSSALGLIVTDNVDIDNFQYEIGYQFSTVDLAASLTAAFFPTSGRNAIYGYTIPRSGKIVGISVAGNRPVVSGAATFDVTINETVTGIQAIIEASPLRLAIGNSGSTGTQFSYMRQDRADTRTHQGFKRDTSQFYDKTHLYGKATALSAGNRVGVSVTTSSGFAPTVADYVVTVYVLE